MNKKIKNSILFIIKIIVSITIIFFLSKKINISEVINHFSELSFLTIILILLIACFKLILEIFNWRLYLKLNPNYKVILKEVVASTFIGHTLRFLIPGGYGTIGKMYFITNKKKQTCVSMGIEKFFQAWLILAFASFAAISYFSNISLIIKILFHIFILLIPILLYFFRIFLKKWT